MNFYKPLLTQWQSFSLINLLGGCVYFMTPLHAQFPEKPLRIIVASAPGGQPDINARMFATELNKQMGQTIIIDNRAGFSGVIGYEMLAKSAPDGYTLSYVAFSLATHPSLLKKVPYDVKRDLQMVILTHTTPNVLAVSQKLPIKSVTELIDYAKAHPAELSFGSSGKGSSSHISMELFKQMTQTQILHVPYKGIQQAVTDIIGGQLQLICDNAYPMMAHISAGRLRGLGLTGTRRIPLAPDLPTVAESGLPQYEITPWGGYAVPAGTPRKIVEKLNAEFNQVVAVPAIRSRWVAVGIEPVGGTPEFFTQHVQKETQKWGGVIRDAGFKNE